MTDAIAIRLRISGRVQAVGYRDWMMREAGRLRLSGWVRNRADGTVEALLMGDEASVDHLVALAEDGPASARVTKVERVTAQPPSEPGFRCLPTE